jgi:hypothetical protein
VGVPNAGYIPESGARQGHNLRDVMQPFSSRPIDVLSDAAMGYTYQQGDLLDHLVKPLRLVAEQRRQQQARQQTQAPAEAEAASSP